MLGGIVSISDFSIYCAIRNGTADPRLGHVPNPNSLLIGIHPPECDWWTDLIWTSPALFGGPLTLGTWGKLPPLSAALPILSEEASMLDQAKNNTTLLLIMEVLHITNCELINRDEGVAIPEYWTSLDHAPRILLELAKNAKITPLYRMLEDQNITNSMKLCALKDCSNYPLTNILHATKHALYTWARWESDENIQVQRSTLVKCTGHTW